MAGQSEITCAVAGGETDAGGHDSRHDLCCTLACAAGCTIVAALLAGPLVLPLRPPSRVGLGKDQLAAAGAPLELYFAARGPPRL